MEIVFQFIAQNIIVIVEDDDDQGKQSYDLLKSNYYVITSEI